MSYDEMSGFRIPDERAVPTTPDYGAELYLRFVENIISRLTAREWERVKKSRDA